LPLFNRVAEITIGKPGTPKAVVIRDLRMSFRVHKDTSRGGNTADITIYNLNEDKLARITRGTPARIKAGYANGDGLQLLFAGKVNALNRRNNGVDSLTEINCSDGADILGAAVVSRSYGNKIPAVIILLDLLRDLKLPIRFVPKARIPRSKLYLHGFSAHGLIRNVMDKVASHLGLEWSIQNGELKVVFKGGVDNSKPILITPATGLLGSIGRAYRSEDTADASKKPSGWIVTSLLQPKAEPFGVVALQSRDLPKKTLFRVEKVDHECDTHEGDWKTGLEVLEKAA
jgi:hypothetical protein